VQVYGEEAELAVITPNQQLAVNKATHQFTKVQIDAVAVLEWKSKFLILDHVTLEEAAAIIADKYNMNVTLANEKLKSCRIMATFLNDETLEHVLTVVSAINHTEFSVNDDGSVILDGKGCN
jgi:transmembrane sensor